jgi:anti-anti-sigma factor
VSPFRVNSARNLYSGGFELHIFCAVLSRQSSPKELSMAPANAALKVEITNDNGTVNIKLIGEARLDLEDAAFQLDRVIVHHPKSVTVDMSELTFLSSIGMSLLVNLRRTAHKSGGTVKLLGMRPLIREALAHARLLELFEVPPEAPLSGAAS